MAKITNISGGPKGVNTIAGKVVVVEPGASIDTFEAGVSDEEAVDLAAAKWFELDEDADEPSDDLTDLTVADLKALATAEAIDLGEATKKAEIVAAIRAARAAKTGS